MCSSRFGVAALSLLITLSICYNSQARSAWDPTPKRQPTKSADNANPYYMSDCGLAHNVGKLAVRVDEDWLIGGSQEGLLCFTGGRIPPAAAEYPRGSGLAVSSEVRLLLGGISGIDTLVSGNEWSEWYPSDYVVFRSTIDPSSESYEGAVSEQDFIITRADYPTNPYWTVWPDFFNDRPHIPLKVQMTSRSYSWSYEYAEDIILFDIEIKNIGTRLISDAFFGIEWNPLVGYTGDPMRIYQDDLGGFVPTVDISFGCGYTDAVNLAWTADNDGDPANGEFTDKVTVDGGHIIKSVRDITGFFFLDYPRRAGRVAPYVSYNWWHDTCLVEYTPGTDFGPRRRSDYHDFRTGGVGTPYGDVNMYSVMGSGEIDYDPAYTASIGYNDPVWMHPPLDQAVDISDGTKRMTYVLSVGPFEIEPGATLSIPMAYVAGEDFHTDPTNGEHLPYLPRHYYRHLDFSDLAENTRWARWLYDNPGVDTDSNGYAGEYMICPLDSVLDGADWTVTRTDTIYYTGDGVPDWRAASPPPAPAFWLEPIVSGIRVRFNGNFSETTRDIFTRVIDFEGYRIYFGRDTRRQSLSHVASYDNENFDKYVYNPTFDPPTWELRDIPFTLDSLRCLYGSGENPCADSSFDPLAFTRTSPCTPYGVGDSVIFFLPHSYNTHQLGTTTPIRKVYPNEPDPASLPVEAMTEDRFTPDGYLKFYEYECIIEDLLPTVPYFINVTAYDFGSPISGLRGLETSITNGIQSTWPLGSADQLAASDKKVFIYPNPYRIDETYRARGYEGRMREDRCDDRVRAVHFENLPAKCWVKVYSLDGDMVAKILHDVNPSDPLHTHHSWGLISRNGQAVVSGLYYWVIESPDGSTQMGKLVIIM